MPRENSAAPLSLPVGHDAFATPAAADRACVRRLRWWHLAAAFMLALFLLGQGLAAPFDKDAESQSAQWAADMVQHGDWLLSHDYYGFVLRKPPLFYWAVAATTLAGGRVDEVRARLPSVIAGAALAVLIMAWTAARLGLGAGWLAFFFLIGMYGYAARAAVALPDMLMTLMLMGSYCVIEPQFDAPGFKLASWTRIVTAGGLLGLGVLTKGPVVIVLLGLAGVLYCAMTRRNPLVLVGRGWPWAMVAVAVAIGAAWYVPAVAAGRSRDLAGVIVDENFGHFFPASLGGTGEAARPVYFILMRLLGGSIPLCLLLPAVIVAWVTGAFKPRLTAALRYQLAMLLAVIILFSAASAKRDDYILPALPPLAVLIAALFGALGDRPSAVTVTKIRNLTAAVIAGCAVLLILILWVIPGFRLHFAAHLRSASDLTFDALFARGITQLAWPFDLFIAAVTVGVIMIIAGLVRRAALIGAGLALVALAGSMLWTGVLKPAELRTRTVAPFIAAVGDRVGTATVYAVYDDPEMAFYYGRALPALTNALAHSGPSASAPPVYLIARPGQLARLAAPVRQRLQPLLVSHARGGGPPTLYLMRPVAPG